MTELSNSDKDRKQILNRALTDCGIAVPEDCLDKLLLYHDLLIEKNKVMNLTAITDFEEAVWKHYADSLAVLKFDDFKQYGSLLDVGSGAGLPGIPLKISCPWLHVTLLDSVGKKVNFHREVINSLHLDQIESVHMRSEDAAHDVNMREQYDIVTARAVSNLATLSEYCLPFVKTGGVFAAYKSENIESELKEAEKAIRTMGGTVISVNSYEIGDNGRTLVLIRKIGKTPKKFPRKAGTPLREPIH